MIEHLQNWIELLFLFAWLATIVFFYLAHGHNKKILIGLFIYSLIQSCLAYFGFYNNASSFPPRFIFILLPAIIVIILGLRKTTLAKVIESKDQRLTTLLHSVRIPVEIVLMQLFLNDHLPEILTYHGRNYDILVGISALLLGVFLFVGSIKKKLLLLWNIVGLGFVLFIMINGILSARTPFQMFALDHPNIAMEYFPFVLLPAVIVPIVIYTHITDIINLSSNKE